MASLQNRSGSYRIVFRYKGKQHFVAIGMVSSEEAEAKLGHVENRLLRLKQGLKHLPDGVGIATFVLHEGDDAPVPSVQGMAKGVAMATLRDGYIAAKTLGREKNTLYTIAIHFKHLAASLGERFPIGELTRKDLQRHVDRRAQLGVSAETIRKEITTMGAAWRWAAGEGLLPTDCPNKDLTYPKGDDVCDYATFEEIARVVAVGGLTQAEIDRRWDALYLQPHEITELLEHVKVHARHPWIYPLVSMAAHTGMRRSELLRMRRADLDLAEGSATVRERKKNTDTRTSRRVTLTPFLVGVLQEWLTVHPGGTFLFCQAGTVAHSKKRSGTTGHQNGEGRAKTLKGRLSTVRRREARPGPEPVTANECHDHFKRTLAGSKWAVVRGLHTLRHSVASCLAAAGIDQRLIDAMLGHVSAQTAKRYRHLADKAKAQAMLDVFG